ncbi:MAG: cobalt ECF transporter T component CbiQ [Treponema sp.]|jgi:cobalt/nickel transport system permease protein|nr:cobalt ECF transporter T component CbiQ [Treponema sp.]
MNLYSAAAGMDRLERLALGTSPIHRLHPRAKLLITGVYVVTVISFPSQNVSGLIPFLLYPAILMSLSGTPYRPLLGRLLTALPFALMGGVSNLFFIPETAFYLGAFRVSIGMVSLASILLKTLLTVFGVLLLIATTSFTDISRQLSLLGMPKILNLQLVMTYRYIAVLLGEARRMVTAYSLRAPLHQGIAMKDMGSFLGQLILRSFDRSERVYHAMQCRGFDGVYRGTGPQGFRPADYGYTLGLGITMGAFRFFNFSVFLGRLMWDAL